MTFITAYVITYLPISTNIVIMGSLTFTSLNCTLPPTTINHTQYCPIINVDREWPHLSVTESGRLICSM